MSNAANVRITKNFEHNLESIRCYLHQQHQSEKYNELLDTLFDTIIPNLQSHPMIGFDFIKQTANSIEELRQVEKIKLSLPKDTSVRQYNDKNYLLLYSLQATEIALLSIKHKQHLNYDLRGAEG